MVSTKRQRRLQLKTLSEIAGYSFLIAWFIIFFQSPVPMSHEVSRWRFYGVQVVLASIVALVIFLIGSIYISIKSVALFIITLFQKRGTD